ncbi:MAG: PDZ domain-containing protein, partial [Thermodesulfovibrionales bacterium]
MAGKKIAAVWLLIITVALIGISIGRLSFSSVSAAGESYEELKTFTEVMSMVKKHYVEEVKTKDLIYGAIRGMLSSLDPHSSFMPPDAYKDMQVETKGEFGGLGIQVGIKDKSLTVIAPIEDTPASRADIKAGDKIVSINKESTIDMSMQDAVSKMRGAPKTSVTIGIMREGWDEPKDFTLIRDVIKMKSIKAKMLEGNIGYVKVTQFQEQTASDLAVALKKLNEEKFTAIILDL